MLLGSLWSFLYSVLTIFCCVCHSLFYHSTVGLLSIPVAVLGILFSATCSILSVSLLYASSIVFWSCTIISNLLSIWYWIQFAFLMFHLCCCPCVISPVSFRVIGKWSLLLRLYSFFHVNSGASTLLTNVRSIVD